jgi:hypothetical protein
LPLRDNRGYPDSADAHRTDAECSVYSMALLVSAAALLAPSRQAQRQEARYQTSDKFLLLRFSSILQRYFASSNDSRVRQDCRASGASG